MIRWLAVLVGSITAVGLRLGLAQVITRTGLSGPLVAPLIQELLALGLAGFVAGHFANRWHIGNAVLAAGGYIMIAATMVAFDEAQRVSTVGLAGLPPIDPWQLAAGDVIGLTAASVGGWLAARGAPDPETTDLR